MDMTHHEAASVVPPIVLAGTVSVLLVSTMESRNEDIVLTSISEVKTPDILTTRTHYYYLPPPHLPPLSLLKQVKRS